MNPEPNTLIQSMQVLANKISTADPKTRKPLMLEYMALAEQLDKAVLCTEIRISHENLAKARQGEIQANKLRDGVKRMRSLHEQSAGVARQSAKTAHNDEMRQFHVWSEQMHTQFSSALDALLEE